MVLKDVFPASPEDAGLQRADRGECDLRVRLELKGTRAQVGRRSLGDARAWGADAGAAIRRAKSRIHGAASGGAEHPWKGSLQRQIDIGERHRQAKIDQ